MTKKVQLTYFHWFNVYKLGCTVSSYGAGECLFHTCNTQDTRHSGCWLETKFRKQTKTNLVFLMRQNEEERQDQVC